MFKKTSYQIFLLAIILFGFSADDIMGQTQARWLGIGSLNNFFMPVGVEREHALVSQQQYGLRWPAIYPHQDSQAARALWIGTTNFTDASNTTYPFRVIHAGPRVQGSSAFFPMEHKLIGKYPATDVFVDEEDTFIVPDDVDEIDPDLPADRVIYTRVNTLVGITIERRIMQFANEHHDNYHIREYTFTNTGQAGPTDEVIYPNKTLTDVMFFYQYRYSVAHQTRYAIGNATGWGINAMIDRFGDGLGPNYDANSSIRGHFAWHGYFPGKIVDYDNRGGPIWTGSGVVNVDVADTTGRLGAYHFVGNAYLHIDTSPDNPANDPNQPFTMTEVGSDAGLNSGNDPFNNADMAREYNEFITAGRTPRHAFLVEPSGDPGFLTGTNDPSRGTSGGFSAASGVGPYTLGPGESVRIVKVDAVSGLSREAAGAIGNAYKRSGGDDDAMITYLGDSKTKNEWVFTGRDSLMQTFNRAYANFSSDFDIPIPPRAPELFNVNSGGDGIYLDWDYPTGEEGRVSGFEIYRALYSTDSTFVKVAELPASARDFAATDDNPAGGPIRGLDHYYYIQAVGLPGDNNGSAMTPAGALRSNRYFATSVDPAQLMRPPGESMSDIIVVPNPYVSSARAEVSFTRPQIYFYEVPGRTRIDIYTELGELVQTLNHDNGSGDAPWNLNTKSRQRIVSGVYIAVIENLDTGERATRKFVVIM
ncbi:MAG: hypothetical protein LAT57_03365 [Balneolales bacterium]|nr:hypothetical protein [Balneolales bacterium]